MFTVILLTSLNLTHAKIICYTTIMMNYEPYGASIEIPINIYLEHIKEFRLFWEDKTSIITNLVQLFENQSFFSNVLKDTGLNYCELIVFMIEAGCPAVKIKVSEPSLIYE